MPATAATAAAVAAPTTYNGTIVKVQSSRYVFWFNVGPKIYKVKYSSKAFVVGSASMLVKGLPVSVTGSFVGNSTTILKASGVTVEDPNPST